MDWVKEWAFEHPFLTFFILCAACEALGKLFCRCG